MSLSSLPNTPEPDLREDMKVLEECLLQATTPREGLWPLFVVLAWVATRDEKFVAATQLYVTRCYADRGSLFSFAAWLCLGRAAEARGGIGFEAAVDQLREALEAGDLDGGQARSIMTDESAPVPRHRWADWNASYESFGIVLIPGLYDFRWPSKAVLECFEEPAAGEAEVALTEAGPHWTEEEMKAEIAHCGIGNREKAWSEYFKPIRDRHGWDNAAFREIWSNGRGTRGMTGRPIKKRA